MLGECGQVLDGEREGTLDVALDDEPVVRASRASSTPTPAAVRFTGNPWGPIEGRRGASNASCSSGRTVWPTLNSVSTPLAVNTEARNVRRSAPFGSPCGSGAGVAADLRGCVRSADVVVVHFAPMWTMSAPIVIQAIP